MFVMDLCNRKFSQSTCFINREGEGDDIPLTESAVAIRLRLHGFSSRLIAFALFTGNSAHLKRALVRLNPVLPFGT